MAQWFMIVCSRLTPVKPPLEPEPVSCRVGDTCVVDDFGIRVNKMRASARHIKSKTANQKSKIEKRL